MGASTMLSKVNTLVNVGYGEELEGETRSSLVNHEQSSYTDQCNCDFVNEEMGILNRKGGRFLNKLYINNEEFREEIINLVKDKSGSIYDYNSNSDPNVFPYPSSEVLTRCCNKCNYIKQLNNFDEGKYTCRSCTSAKVNCPYCTSVVRYDGIRAHVRKQHPDIELTRGFSRNLQSRFPDITDRCNRFADKTINPSWQSPRAVSPLVINQTEESCSCKYYNFVSFLINNGINIEKIKENINLLKSIDNLK